MIVHPSLIEKVSLDAREHNADVAADVKRSFAYVGPITVVAHEADADAPVTNEMRLICRMSRPYWTDEGDGAQMWQAMRDWLGAKAYKVESTIANFNKSRSEAGHQTVSYDRVVLDMKPYELGVACPEADKLPDLVQIAQRMRELIASGAIAADVRGIEAPAAASLAEQVERSHEQARQRAAQEAAAAAEQAAGEGAGENGETAVPEAGEALAEQAAGGNAAAEAAGADAASDAEAAGAADDASASDSDPASEQAAAEPEAPARLPHASDDVEQLDYTLWDVRLADGSTRTLDSASGTWL